MSLHHEISVVVDGLSDEQVEDLSERIMDLMEDQHEVDQDSWFVTYQTINDEDALSISMRG